MQASSPDAHIFGYLVYTITEDSMAPNFRAGHRLLVRARSIESGAPSRGDAVIIGYDDEPERRSLKRVVGLPGESIRLGEGSLFIDSHHVYEPYLRGLPANLGLDELSWTLGDDDFFVMGDNRAHSVDSRKFGPVPLRNIVGRVLFRLWPLWRRRAKLL